MAVIGAITSGLGAASSIYSGMKSQSGQSSANAANRQQALVQMMFERNMANTAHRREVKDLRAAGLNPILSGTGGHGAASPSGAMSHYENAKGAGVSSALAALSTLTEALLTKQQTEKTKAETDNTLARTATEREQPGLVREQTRLTGNNANSAVAQMANISLDNRLKEIGYRVQMSELDKNNELTQLFRKQGLTQSQITRLTSLNADQAAEVYKGLKTEGMIDESQYGVFLRVLGRLLPAVNSFVPAVKALK